MEEKSFFSRDIKLLFSVVSSVKLRCAQSFRDVNALSFCFFSQKCQTCLAKTDEREKETIAAIHFEDRSRRRRKKGLEKKRTFSCGKTNVPDFFCLKMIRKVFRCSSAFVVEKRYFSFFLEVCVEVFCVRKDNKPACLNAHLRGGRRSL